MFTVVKQNIKLYLAYTYLIKYIYLKKILRTCRQLLFYSSNAPIVSLSKTVFANYCLVT